jgi:hypothetical protein
LDLAFYNQLTQGLVIGQYIAGNVKLANMMTKLAKKLRKAGFRKTANSLKASAKTLEGYAQKAKYLTTMHMVRSNVVSALLLPRPPDELSSWWCLPCTRQKILRAGNLAEKKVDPNASLSVEALAAKKDAEREAAYLSAGGKKKKWEVKFDEEALKKCVRVLIFSRVASCRLRCALCHYGRRTDARASQVLGQHGHGRSDVRGATGGRRQERRRAQARGDESKNRGEEEEALAAVTPPPVEHFAWLPVGLISPEYKCSSVSLI